MDRETLKSFFKKGSFPSEVNFADLLDSTVNKVDDGFEKNRDDGLKLSPQGSSKTLISFFEKINHKNPSWSVKINPNSAKGLSFSGFDGKSNLFIEKGGNVGIGTTNPKQKLDVKGMVAMEGRIGTYKKGFAPADKSWTTILSGLSGCQAFEIMAHASSRKGAGKYAIAHVIAVSAYGTGANVIRETQAYFATGWASSNKIMFRWVGEVEDYSLEVRTSTDFGIDLDDSPRQITYRISKLWDNIDEQEQLSEEEEEME